MQRALKTKKQCALKGTSSKGTWLIPEHSKTVTLFSLLPYEHNPLGYHSKTASREDKAGPLLKFLLFSLRLKQQTLWVNHASIEMITLLYAESDN